MPEGTSAKPLTASPNAALGKYVAEGVVEKLTNSNTIGFIFRLALHPDLHSFWLAMGFAEVP